MADVSTEHDEQESNLTTTYKDSLVLDIDGDGLELSGVQNSPAYFDVDADGVAEKTGWVGADDAILVIDYNANNNIDDITELFGGTFAPMPRPGLIPGLMALEELDSNFDGVISAQDTNFLNLRLWQDTNQNGISETVELKTLTDLNIKSISVGGDSNTSTDVLGNHIARIGHFTKTDNTQHTIGEVYFGFDDNDDLSGNNSINGIATADILKGKSGNDTIHGNNGNDSLDGGADADKLYGDNGDDSLAGSSGNDSIYGGEGRDLIQGGDDNDFLYGDAGLDTLYGGNGNDYIDAGTKNDVLFGDAGNDILNGNWGNDTITGSAGADTLTGGLDADTFRYNSVADSTDTARDVITDFTHLVDRINLSGLGFTGIQAGAASGTVLGYTIVNGHTIIDAANSDFSIDLNGNITLTDGDFIFS